MTAAPCAPVRQAVEALDEPLPDWARLAAGSLTPGSVGWAYGAFMARHGLRPLSLSPAVRREVAAINLVAARYVLVHDLFHVLLGFDVSRAGELAVWTFVGQQRYSPSYGHAAALAALLYPLAEPSARAEMRRHRALGLALAQQVPCLIGQPLEHYWPSPLADARRALGIPVGPLV